MTASEALHSIPFWQLHPGIMSLTISTIFTIAVIVTTYKDFKGDDDKIEWKDFIGFNAFIYTVSLMLLFIALSVGGIMKGLSETQKANLLRTPVEQLQVNKTQLIGATSSGFTKSEISGGMFYLSGNTSDTTSYRYVTSSDKGYQVTTLSDHYGDINPNDVYVKQVQNKAQLVVVKQRFKNKQVRNLIDSYTKNDSEWTTYTFEVPNPKILNSFNFK